VDPRIGLDVVAKKSHYFLGWELKSGPPTRILISVLTDMQGHDLTQTVHTHYVLSHSVSLLGKKQLKITLLVYTSVVKLLTGLILSCQKTLPSMRS